jgi:hypothetical protein
MSHQADAKGWLRDGNTGFTRGADGNTPPNVLSREHVAKATNTTFRGGKGARPRPGWRRRELSFATGTETNFETGRFQHAAFYDGNSRPSLMAHIGGRLFKTDVITWKVSDISVTDDPNSSKQPMGWSCQAENYFIYQDNQSLPIIYDGASSRRANRARSEIPVGNVMAYTMGRLVVALPDRTTFRVGDLVFGPSGTIGRGYRDSMLRFTENDYLNEGGEFVARVFGAPSGYGNITAMKAVSQTDTSLGQGPLLVGTPDTVFTLNLPFDRNTWKDMASALQTVSPIKGPLGQNSTVLVNGDAWYRADDGIRSFIMAQRDFATSWGNAPMSAEVDDTLAYDSPHLLEYGSGVHWNRWLIQTVSPATNNDGVVWHRGLAVIDFNPVGGIASKVNPQWDGIWTGLRILQVVKGRVAQRERCFVFALSDNDEIQLWEMVVEDKFDNVDDPIDWTLTVPSFPFGNIDQLKKLQAGRVVFHNVLGDLSGTVKYRSDQNPCWQPWDSFAVCSKDKDCSAECAGPRTYRAQPRAPIRLKTPPDVFDAIDNKNHRTGYEFQAKLELSGYGELQHLILFASDQPEQMGIEQRTQT